jgi:osmoprotectant transport system ATP-binding protein
MGGVGFMVAYDTHAGLCNNIQNRGPGRNMSVSFEHVSKRYDPDTLAVDDISFTAASGELVVLVGESGCGKTTTLKLINRLIEPTSGRILIDDRDVTQVDAVTLRRSTGYVFQSVGLFPHMTVGENIGITPALLDWDLERIAARVDYLLDLVQLPPGQFRDRVPEELSGGQAQRVGFARALAAEPTVMLLDEAFGSLDPLTRDSLRDDFRAIHEKLSLTSVLVTHDMTEALLLADRIIVIRAGRIVQNGAAHELLSTPADDYIEELLSTPRRQSAELDALMAGRLGHSS